MGICRYCHQKAGWFTEVHDTCVQKANAAIEAVKNCMSVAVIEGKQYSDISESVNKLATDAGLSLEQLRTAVKDGWNQGAENRSKAEPISAEEMEAMDKILSAAGFTTEEGLWSVGGWAMTFSYLIWTVIHDRIQPSQRQSGFNLQAGEVPVWGMPNVLLKQQCTTTSYVGGSSGVSIRIASGLYTRLGGLRGHKVESESLQEMDYGDFLMTTQAIYFGGTERGMSFRLPYTQIIRLQPYSDAVGVCKNGAREQIFFPIGVHTPVGLALARGIDSSRVQILLADRPEAPMVFPDCGWFLFNVLQALAARDSAARSHHA
jgi:hypothetical protein